MCPASSPLAILRALTVFIACALAADLPTGTASAGDRSGVNGSPLRVSDLHARFVTSTSARITWTSDPPGTSLVEVLSGESVVTRQSGPGVVTHHSVEIGQLSPGTTYRYRVVSTDVFGRRTVSPDRTFVTRSEEPWTTYHSVDGPNGVRVELERLAREFPEYVQLSSMGKTHRGRDIWALTISGKNTSPGTPGVLIDGGFHGHEWIGTETALYIAWYITNHYGADPQVSRLVDGRRIWVIPMVNPDGRAIDGAATEEDHEASPASRKNGRVGAGTGASGRCGGVDINRNFDLGYGIGASGDPCDAEHLGPSPFSEPETRAFRTFARARPVSVYVSYHSPGNLIYYPWGYRSDPTTDDVRYRQVSQGLASRLPGYRPLRAGAAYAGGGAADDWMYHNFRAMAFTLEVGSANRPPDGEIRGLIRPHAAAALYLLELAGDPWQDRAPASPSR